MLLSRLGLDGSDPCQHHWINQELKSIDAIGRMWWGDRCIGDFKRPHKSVVLLFNKDTDWREPQDKGGKVGFKMYSRQESSRKDIYQDRDDPEWRTSELQKALKYTAGCSDFQMRTVRQASAHALNGADETSTPWLASYSAYLPIEISRTALRTWWITSISLGSGLLKARYTDLPMNSAWFFIDRS